MNVFTSFGRIVRAEAAFLFGALTAGLFYA